jgi:hypothetical protein
MTAHRIRAPLAMIGLIVAASVLQAGGNDTGHAVSQFRMQEVETGLKVGYAVLLVDIDGDSKKDIVVVDTNRVVWYQNPTWKRRTIIQGQTLPDNVCIAAYDIDGDGRLDLALGADWKPFNTRAGGTIQWLRRGKTLDDPWTLYPIDTEPTVHRMRFADVLGLGKPQLVVAPLMGRGSTKEKNWLDGEPVRVLAYRFPSDPTRDRWVPEVIDHSLHVVHNLWPIPAVGGGGTDLLLASYEGVTRLTRQEAHWRAQRLAQGDQSNPAGSRGSSEIKQGRLPGGGTYLAAIEPWHGNQVVVYTQRAGTSQSPWRRHVLDTDLKWGHAVWCADLDCNGSDVLIVGVRDNLANKEGKRRGLRIYRPQDAGGEQWHRTLVDDGGVAVEDMAADDLDNDGRIDIVAVGRQTGNVRIYWNTPGR